MIPFLRNKKPSLSPLKRKPQANHSCFFSSKTLKLLLLAFLGMTPVVGFVADIANAGISVARGNYADASINLAAAVPGAGQAVMGAKFAAAGFGVYKSAKFAKGVDAGSSAVGRTDKYVNVYRAFGDDARAKGFSWTTTDPRTVRNFRDLAGLPSGGASGANNSAEFLIKGRAKISDVIKFKSADPLDGNTGGLPELIIHPKNVNLTDFSVIKP